MLHKIFFFALSILMLSSCVVSKKKYEALLADRNQLSEQLDDKSAQNEKLNTDLSSAISDYEKMRYDLTKSNALKSDEVSDLMIRVTDYQTKTKLLNQELENTLNEYANNKQYGQLTSQQLEQAEKQLAQLKRDTAGLHYSIKLAKERNELVRKELTDSQAKYSLTYKEFTAFKEQASKTEIQLKTLETQIVEQKETMESISKSFIELRKQLLTAKSDNTPIDPNKNNHIDRIAKLLGHY